MAPRGEWRFDPIYDEGSKDARAWKVFVNRIEVGLVVQTPRDLIVFSRGEPGELLAHRLQSVGTEDILAAFEEHSQRRLESGR